MTTTEKPLPQDVAAERSLVGLWCEDWQPDADYVPPDAFYDPQWRLVSVCAHALHGRGEPVNAERLDGELRTRNLVGEGRPIASISDVTECMNNIPPGETGGTLAARIQDAWERRRAIAGAQELAVAAFNDHTATWKTTRVRIACMLAEAGAKGEDQNSLNSSFVASWPAAPSETAYYGLAGDVVRLLAPHTEAEADPFALLLQFVVYFGAVVGPKPHFIHESTRHGMNLFAVLVGPTGKGRKGTSHDRVAALYRAIDATWTREHVLKGLSSGEGLIAALRDQEDETATPDLLRKAVLVYETEFAAPLEQMSRQGNILSSTLRQAWDTDTLGTLTRNDPLKATGVHVAMIGHITRDDLQRYMTNTLAGNGLGNRILWAASKRANVLPFGGEARPDGIEGLEKRLRETVAFARGVGCMGMSEAARALWVKVYDRLSAERLGLYGKMTSRAEAQTRRLACLFALLDKRAAVEVSHLKAALAVWAFADRTVRFVFGEQIGDALADTLLAALRKAGANGCTLSDLHAATGRNVKASILHEKLSFLERNGYARHVPEPPGARGGHPGERWYSVEQDDAPAPNEATKNDLTEETGEDVPSSGVDSSDSFFVASSRNGYHPELHPWKPLYDELVAGGMDPRDALFQAKAESQRGDTR